MSTYSHDVQTTETLQNAEQSCPKAPKLRARRAPLSEANLLLKLPESTLNFVKSEKKKRFFTDLLGSSNIYNEDRP